MTNPFKYYGYSLWRPVPQETERQKHDAIYGSLKLGEEPDWSTCQRISKKFLYTRAWKECLAKLPRENTPEYEESEGEVIEALDPMGFDRLFSSRRVAENRLAIISLINWLPKQFHQGGAPFEEALSDDEFPDWEPDPEFLNLKRAGDFWSQLVDSSLEKSKRRPDVYPAAHFVQLGVAAGMLEYLKSPERPGYPSGDVLVKVVPGFHNAEIPTRTA